MEPDFNKSEDGLLPAVVQDIDTKLVLMLGYMDRSAMEKTTETGKVTFFSRSKGRLWTKGEESGNYLDLVDIKIDCDNDSFLVRAKPRGPVCHLGTDTCWGEKYGDGNNFISRLEGIISERKDNPSRDSYVSSLFRNGINKIAQKVGEEAVEVVIEAKDENRRLFLEESADLLFHYLILLQAKGVKLADVEDVLRSRHK